MSTYDRRLLIRLFDHSKNCSAILSIDEQQSLSILELLDTLVLILSITNQFVSTSLVLLDKSLLLCNVLNRKR